MSNNKANELRAKVSRMIIECRSQDGQIDEWGERELRDDILQLITSEKEAAYKKGYLDGVRLARAEPFNKEPEIHEWSDDD